jgi:hypothetical protein
MSLDQTRANEILTWMHGGAAPTALSGGTKLALFTVVGTATTAGTEVATGGGYTSGTAGRIALTWAGAAAGSQATSAIASVTNYPRAESVAAVEIYEGGGTFRRVEWGALQGGSKAMAAGDTLSFAAGAITSAVG